MENRRRLGGGQRRSGTGSVGSARLSGLVPLCDPGLACSCSLGRFASASKETEKKRGADDLGVRLSVSELRRLIHVLQEPAGQRQKRLWWSRFRRVHQAGASRGHVQRRARQAPRVSLVPGPPIRLLGLPDLTADRWERLRPLLPKPRSGHEASENLPLVEAILWVMQTGSTWREIPERFGPWLTVAERFYRWRKEGRWDRILQVLQEQESPFALSA